MSDRDWTPFPDQFVERLALGARAALGLFLRGNDLLLPHLDLIEAGVDLVEGALGLGLRLAQLLDLGLQPPGVLTQRGRGLALLLEQALQFVSHCCSSTA
jgi:hypothetical protein